MKGIRSRIVMLLPTDNIDAENCAVVRMKIRELAAGLISFTAEFGGKIKVNVKKWNHGEPKLKKKKANA